MRAHFTEKAPSRSAFGRAILVRMDSTPPSRIVIFGDGRLARAIERGVAARALPVERYAFRETTDLEALDLEHVGAVALTADDDTGNVDLAITLRAMRPSLRLVVRMFDPTLANYLQRTLPNITVTSMTDVAAPAFVGAVLDGVERQPVRVHGTRRSIGSILPSGWDRLLVRTALATAGVIAVATAFFARVLNLDAITALYFVSSTITTVGYGDITLHHAPPYAQIAGIFLMFGGTALSTLAFALLTEWLLDRRIHVLEGRMGVDWQDHAIVVGGGNIGYRVAALLRRRGMRVVIIEKDAHARHVLGARADGDHVIVADALSDGILELANVEHAAAVVAVTNSDAVNLHVGIAARERCSSITVVMRVVSPVLSAHVSTTHEAVALSPLAVTTDAFVEALTRSSASS
jgi:voltage-gated potassium channel Kch